MKRRAFLKNKGTLIKYSAWLLSLNVFSSFSFSSSKHNILLLKYTFAEFISIKLPWENQIKK